MPFDRQILCGTSFRGKPTILICFIILMLTVTPISGAASENRDGTTGLHDDAQVLTGQERVEIEQAIDAVESAGAPTVVYLRLFSTEDDRAVEDAQNLMASWSIESAPGARDGVVMFFNLEPDDPDRGEFGIVAGEAHFDGGALPQSELNRIRDEMIELLADDQLAQGIVLGLELTEGRLQAGPPEASALESFLGRVATGPVSPWNAAAIIGAVLLSMGGWRTWKDRPRVDHQHIQHTTTPPEDLNPAMAGALARGRVTYDHIEATLIELAQQGAIAFEPDPHRDEKVRLQILDLTRVKTVFEREIIARLNEAAEGALIDQDTLLRTSVDLSKIQRVIQEDLERIGWFDPSASQRRMPLFVTGTAALLLGIVAFAPIAVIEEPWVIIGGSVLALVGAVQIGGATNYPRTTPEGEQQALQWRAYRDGLQAAATEPYGTVNLDESFSFIVAFGLSDRYKQHLEAAGDEGYVPRWFRTSSDSSVAANSWFIYWIAVQSAMGHNTDTGTGGSVAGGAATGSGGAGGRF